LPPLKICRLEAGANPPFSPGLMRP